MREGPVLFLFFRILNDGQKVQKPTDLEIPYCVKKKSIPVTGRGGLQGCKMLIPHFLDSWLIDGGEGVSLTRRPRFNPRKIYWYSFLSETE
jgi:hypothetical protein